MPWKASQFKAQGDAGQQSLRSPIYYARGSSTILATRRIRSLRRGLHRLDWPKPRLNRSPLSLSCLAQTEILFTQRRQRDPFNQRRFSNVYNFQMQEIIKETFQDRTKGLELAAADANLFSPKGVHRRHNIVEKDYFRLLKTNKLIQQSEKKRQKTPLSISKFRTRSDLLIDEYKRPSLPKERLYMIEKLKDTLGTEQRQRFYPQSFISTGVYGNFRQKLDETTQISLNPQKQEDFSGYQQLGVIFPIIEKVARLRAAQGRYGVDHSEVLNYEFELANKDRADHMNTLVYKSSNQEQDAAKHSLHRTKSNAIFERLTEKEVEEHLRRASVAIECTQMTYNEWLRRKDAEERMKKKLIKVAKSEMRQELFEMAQQEQADAEFKVKMMEEWALQQRVDEAQLLARTTKGFTDKQELERQIARDAQKSFKQWVKKEKLLDERKRLLSLIERKEQIEERQQEEARMRANARKEYSEWSQKQAVQRPKHNHTANHNQDYSPLRVKQWKEQSSLLEFNIYTGQWTTLQIGENS